MIICLGLKPETLWLFVYWITSKDGTTFIFNNIWWIQSKQGSHTFWNTKFKNFSRTSKVWFPQIQGHGMGWDTKVNSFYCTSYDDLITEALRGKWKKNWGSIFQVFPIFYENGCLFFFARIVSSFFPNRQTKGKKQNNYSVKTKSACLSGHPYLSQYFWAKCP